MNNFLKIAMAGAGAYFLYEYFRPSLGGAPTPAPAPATSAGAAAAQPNTLALMRAAAAKDSVWQTLMSPHQWNFLYGQVLPGKVPPDPGPAWPGVDTTTANFKVTLDEWYTKMSGATGLSGWVIR